jgi:hypothetical protein
MGWRQASIVCRIGCEWTIKLEEEVKVEQIVPE